MKAPLIQYSTAASASTVTCLDYGESLCVIHETTLVALLTLSLPATPVGGQSVKFVSVGGVTALTLSGGTVVNALTTIAAGGTCEYTYTKDTSKWYKTI